jgi:glycosyltransferase involved in cell wall biosynthesis
VEKHIAMFLMYMSPGGAQRAKMNIARELILKGFKVDLILANCGKEHIGLIPDGVNVVDLKAKREFGAMIRLSRYLRREKPHVIIAGLHLANEIAILARALSGARTRVVIVEHSFFSMEIKHTTWKRRAILPFCAKYLYRFSDSIVAVSKGVAEDLLSIKGIPGEKVKVIYNISLTEDIYEKAREPVSHPWFGEKEKPVILGVGRLETAKDFPTLIRAFAEVRKKKDVRLVILGWGTDDARKRLESLAGKLGVKDEVSLPGEMKNPYPYIKGSALFVLSSVYEGMSIVLVEALALRCPVVSTDCPSSPREVLHDGAYGEMVPPGDELAMAGAILRVLDEGSCGAPEEWLEQFKGTSVIPRYLDVMGFSEVDRRRGL